jgi:hypothetical protein
VVVYGQDPESFLPNCPSANGSFYASVEDVSLIYNHGREYN